MVNYLLLVDDFPSSNDEDLGGLLVVELDKRAQVLYSYVLDYSLYLIQVLTILMAWRGFLVASWYRYTSSLLR